MLQFIVLGLVPGTNIQINFEDVLRITLGLIMLLILIREIARYCIDVKAHGTLFPFLNK